MQNNADAVWVLNHQFLQLHMKDVADPPKYEAIVQLGYVQSEKQYVAFWTDTFGAKFAGVGRGTRSGNSIEFRFGEPATSASGGRNLCAVDTAVPAT